MAFHQKILQSLLLLTTKLAPLRFSARCAFSSQQGVIKVTPKVSLFDQKVHVKVQGLPSKVKVTLSATSQHDWAKKPLEFVSCGHYVTSEDGDLDLHRDASLGGTYTGLEPMGPFWSVRPSPAGPQNVRMVVKVVPEPVHYTFSVFPGHLEPEDLVVMETRPVPFCSLAVPRLRCLPGVRRVPIREGNVRGTLFLPPGEGPHPGVMDMYGMSGGLTENRAALLASHGFATLALAYLRYQDLPHRMADITFDYFEEAVSWFNSLKSVKPGGIGVIGMSFGSQYALLMAWLLPQIKAIVIINGSPFYTIYDLYWRGKVIKKAVFFDLGKIKYTEKGMIIQQMYPHWTVDDFTPVWESSAHVLGLQCDDDLILDPQLVDVLHAQYPEDKRHLMTVVHYPGAGHCVDPPNVAFCSSCSNPVFGGQYLWGGNAKDHADAQEDAWKRSLEFFKTHLS